MLDTVHVRPVIGGKWHLTRMTRHPEWGEDVTALCGAVYPAGYRERQSAVRVVTQCWECDLIYRREHRMHVGAEHPAVQS